MVIEFGAACIFGHSVFLFLMSFTAIIAFPHFPIFFGSILSPSAPFLLKLPICYMLPIYSNFMLAVNSFLIVLTCYAYGVYFVPFVIIHLHMGRSKYSSISALRKPPTLLNAYRSVQVFQQQVNNLIGIFIMPTQVMISQIVIVSCYTMIRQAGLMKPSTIYMLGCWAGATFGFWAFQLLIGGYLHFYGSKVLNSWKYHRWENKAEKKLMGKFRKSCKPVCLSYKTVYIIKRLTVLRFIRSISRGILRALLTL